ncbi:protein RarD [Vibrio parahaemolyticus]|nr:EamA family transporter RarD [Vibrio parahaemolyticus]MCR9766740.1 EamA family transporter RarD [Vibrio parahaemolyticus]MCX4129166.1 EamA family transporter RarD [Vibrio parahaemolyticus]MDF4755219.1 EamA family transporter RarD [Vibrio parahaemolyticus]TOR08897.1 protein RarD [Vibrio parahaemolyticus]
MTPEEQQRARQGVLLAVGAYTMWGIAPMYFKSIAQVSPLEILSHRVIWSFFLLAALLHFGRHWRSVYHIATDKKKIAYLLSSSVLIGGNWLIFIWAVNSNHMLDASLGYYINPLINVLLGMVFLGERLRKLQWFAVVLAGCGVLVQLIVFGSVPIVAMALAMSFGFYGLLRKKVAVDAQTGLFVETLILLPAAAVYLLFIASSPTANMIENPWQLNTLLIAAGVVTTLPLLCFTGAATRLKLSTLGFFQLSLIKPIFLKLETNSQTPRCNGFIKIYS